MRTKEREVYLKFTKPLLSFPAVIIVRRDVPGKMRLADLKGKRVGSPSGYAQFERLKQDHPQIEAVGVADPQTCLRQVSVGELDACILRLPVATHFITAEGIVNLRIAGEIDAVYALAAACRSDWPELTAILDAAIETITQQQRDTIFRNWVRLEADVPFYATGRFWLTVAVSLVAVGIVFAAVLFWNWQLRSVVTVRTAELAQHRDHLEEAVGRRPTAAAE